VVIEHRPGEGVVSLSSGPSSFTLNCHQASEFPELPPDVGEGIMLPAATLLAATEHVTKAASRDDTRPVLTGVLVRLEVDSLTMVATDSYRLAVRRGAITNGPTEPVEALIPARALAEAQRVVAFAAVDEVELVLTETQCTLRAGDVRLTTRLIDGQFPNYRQLLPESVEHELHLSSAEVTDVVRRISLLAQKNAPLRLSFCEGELTVSAQTPDIGEASETIPVAFHGEPFEIGFNPEFLRDGLESVESDELVLKLISPLRPGLIESPGSGDFVYLIMPIRLNA